LKTLDKGLNTGFYRGFSLYSVYQYRIRVPKILVGIDKMHRSPKNAPLTLGKCTAHIKMHRFPIFGRFAVV